MARKGKLDGRLVWILDVVQASGGRKLMYYREMNGSVTNVKTAIVEPKVRSKNPRSWRSLN